MTDQTLEVTWREYIEAVDTLAHKLNEVKHTIDLVVGVSRGGLIPATMLSHKFDKPLIVVQPDSKLFYPMETVLVVDDVSDSGKTLQQLKAGSIVGEWKDACVFIKPKTVHVPGFWARSTDQWILFPYETKV